MLTMMDPVNRSIAREIPVWMDSQNFTPAIDEPEELDAALLLFGLQELNVMVQRTDAGVRIPQAHNIEQLSVGFDRRHYLGVLENVHCFALDVPQVSNLPDSIEFHPLRSLHGSIPDDHWSLAGRALQIVEWGRTHRFCGRCGTATVPVQGQRATRCPKCGLTNYPRISPAVITLVYRGDEMLLARSSNFPDAFYSVLAGFVEPGETLEETVAREIHEETGIFVKNIRYFGSQPWPFPHSLMIGFTAEYERGEIVLLDDEILEAGWYTVDNLPRIPGNLSISRQLIDWFIDLKS